MVCRNFKISNFQGGHFREKNSFDFIDRSLMLGVVSPASAYLYQDNFETGWSGVMLPAGIMKVIVTTVMPR